MAINEVVKLFTDDDGGKYHNKYWHLVDPANPQGTALLCTGEFFGEGESGAKYETKDGKITCPDCISILKIYKAIKL